jgi:hypothetical protein
MVLYHGTALPLGERIQAHGVRPKEGNKYVYFTTDRKVAEHYAKAWTAYYVEEAPKQLNIKNPKPIGALLTFNIPDDYKWIEKDPYNEEGEPNQYRILGKHLNKDFILKYPEKLEKINFPELKDKTELLKAYCYWIGIGRATDESAARGIMSYDEYCMNELSGASTDLLH